MPACLFGPFRPWSIEFQLMVVIKPDRFSAIVLSEVDRTSGKGRRLLDKVHALETSRATAAMLFNDSCSMGKSKYTNCTMLPSYYAEMREYAALLGRIDAELLRMGRELGPQISRLQEDVGMLNDTISRELTWYLGHSSKCTETEHNPRKAVPNEKPMKYG